MLKEWQQCVNPQQLKGKYCEKNHFSWDLGCYCVSLVHIHAYKFGKKHPCWFEWDRGFLIDLAFSLWLSCFWSAFYITSQNIGISTRPQNTPPTRYSSKQQLPFRLGNTMLKDHAKCSVFGWSKELKTLHRVPVKEDRRAAWVGFIFWW